MSCIEVQSSNESGIPDVANAAVVLTSSISAEGGSVGPRVFSSRHNGSIIKPMESLTIHDGADSKTKKPIISQYLNENNLSWSVNIRNDILYVELPLQINIESRERFLSLLEFADETLHCKYVIINFDKTRPDRAIIVKTFMFLGFQALSPENTLMQNIDKRPDQLFMMYIIDGND